MRSGSEMPTFAEAYRSLFSGRWTHKYPDGFVRVRRPEEFGLSVEDALVCVCDLCLWQQCEGCRFHTGDWRMYGSPSLGLVLQGEEYREGLPAGERRRDLEEEEPETVELAGDALVIQRSGTVSTVFPRSMRWATDREVEKHPAFQAREEEAVSTKSELVLYCDGGRRYDGSTYGSFRVGNGRVHTREFGLEGSHNVAEYKALINALHVARKRVETCDHDLVTIRLDSELVRNQVLGTWRCKAPHLQVLRERAREELDAVLAVMRRRSGKLGRVRLEHIPEAEMKRVLGH